MIHEAPTLYEPSRGSEQGHHLSGVHDDSHDLRHVLETDNMTGTKKSSEETCHAQHHKRLMFFHHSDVPDRFGSPFPAVVAAVPVEKGEQSLPLQVVLLWLFPPHCKTQPPE